MDILLILHGLLLNCTTENLEIIGLIGQEITAACFPDLIPMDFYLCGSKTTSVQRNSDNKRRHEGTYKKSLRCD